MRNQIIGFLGLEIVLLSCWLATGLSTFPCDNFYKNRCYKVISSGVKGYEAAVNCARNGGFLAVIKDRETQDFLLPLLNKGSTYWIGLYIVYGFGAFSDGSAFSFGSFAPWASGYTIESSYQERKCVYLNPSDKSWNAAACDDYYYNRRSYICEYKDNSKALIKTMKECPNQKNLISNGKTECSDREAFESSEELNVQCNIGYYLAGNSTITCQHNGLWKEPPKCVQGCKAPIVPESITILNPQQGYSVGQTVRLLCEDGFFGVGEEMKNCFNVTCQSNGSWSDIVPECHKFQDYQKISFIPNAIQIEVEKNEDITFNSTKFTNINSIVWLKNSKKLKEVKNKHQIDNKTGSLTIRKFSLSDEGLYSYILKSNEHISSITYNLKMNVSDKCTGEMEEKLISVDCNEDCFLQCGNISSTEVRWYKDKQRIWGNSHQTILPDGNLILYQAQKSDEGEYSCYVADLSLQCTQEFKISLLLNSSRSEIQCGIKENDLEMTPWLVSLWYPTDVVPFCYGTLIDDKWILTTASCVSESHRKRNPDISVKINLQKDNAFLVESFFIGVSKIQIHPYYSSTFRSNDIALVLLNSSIKMFNNAIKVSPICLPEDPYYFCKDGILKEGYVSGLGPLNSQYLSPRRERMSIISSKQCPVITSINSKGMFCATANSSSVEDAFAGDKGSPFEVNMDGRWVLWGFFNYGERATLNGELDFFTRIKSFLPWINSARRF